MTNSLALLHPYHNTHFLTTGWASKCSSSQQQCCHETIHILLAKRSSMCTKPQYWCTDTHSTCSTTSFPYYVAFYANLWLWSKELTKQNVFLQLCCSCNKIKDLCWTGFVWYKSQSATLFQNEAGTKCSQQLGGWREPVFWPLQPRTSQKQVSVQGKTALSFSFRLESSIRFFAYTISLKKK